MSILGSDCDYCDLLKAEWKKDSFEFSKIGPCLYMYVVYIPLGHHHEYLNVLFPLTILFEIEFVKLISKLFSVIELSALCTIGIT